MTAKEAEKVIYEMICLNLLTPKEDEALHIAYQAIKKQIPEKPIHITRNEHSIRIIGYGCPTCHKDITGGGFCCWNCGQTIDWSEEK